MRLPDRSTAGLPHKENQIGWYGRCTLKKEGREMVWVGSFKSLENMLYRPRLLNAPLEVRTWVPPSIDRISPLVDWLTGLIA